MRAQTAHLAAPGWLADEVLVPYTDALPTERPPGPVRIAWTPLPGVYPGAMKGERP